MVHIPFHTGFISEIAEWDPRANSIDNCKMVKRGHVCCNSATLYTCIYDMNIHILYIHVCVYIMCIYLYCWNVMYNLDVFLGENNKFQVKYSDSKVCKSFLLACCPHEILSSTVSISLDAMIPNTNDTPHWHCAQNNAPCILIHIYDFISDIFLCSEEKRK